MAPPPVHNGTVAPMEGYAEGSVQAFSSEFRHLLWDLLSAKRADKEIDTADYKVRGAMLLLKLKEAVRNESHWTEREKNASAASKEQLDRFTLKRNNLLSEEHHQKTEIQSCRDFKTKYPTIELCDLEEFHANAAQSGAPPDEHTLYVQRLHFELAERERLCKQLGSKQARKKELEDQISAKKKFLQSLGSLLKGVKKSTQPIQERFGMHHTWKAKQGRLARLLPAPMFVLYSLLLAHKETADDACDVRIHGSASAAETLLMQGSGDKTTSGVKEDASDERDTKRQKLGTELQAMSIHPLSVVVDLLDELGKKTLSLRFDFLLHPAGGVVLASCQPEDLALVLVNLLPDDTGRVLPHASETFWNPKAAGVASQGHPYLWAQHLGGLDFLPPVPPSLLLDASMSSQEVSSQLASMRKQHRVPKLVALLKQRVQAQMELRTIGKSLPGGFNSATRGEFQMTEWSKVVDAQNKGVAAEAEDGELSTQENGVSDVARITQQVAWQDYMSQTFRAVLKSSKVVATVEVTTYVEHPVRPPLFKIVELKAPKPAGTDVGVEVLYTNQIQAVESAVNYTCIPSDSSAVMESALLSRQLDALQRALTEHFGSSALAA